MSLRKNVLEVLADRKRSISVDELFGPEEVEFRTLLSKAKKEGCTHFVILAYAVQGGIFAKQLREMVPNALARFGNSSVRGADFFEAAGPAADGFQVSFMDVDSNHPAAKEFKERFKKEVSNTAANAYDVVFILQNAFSKCAQEASSRCLKKSLFEIKNYNGLSGSKSFDDINGDMEDRYVIKVAHSGTFVPR